jgi:CRISPR-associated protein Cmr6
MVSGLGASHPFETGFIWHRTLSVPYLPGSSVKGLLRAWAEQWGGSDDKEQISRLFGTGGDNDGQAGAIIVFDALPSQPPKSKAETSTLPSHPPQLELDIINPHYSDYYKNPATTPPADYLDPSPVFFLAVAPGQSFRFFLAPRLGFYSKQNGIAAYSAADDLETAKQLLINALVHLGIGAKTAVGYGQMTALEYQEKEQANNAQKWLDEVIEGFRKDKDFKGQPEKVFWQNALSEKWLRAPSELKPLILELIKAKWVELNINWQQPSGNSAQAAKRNFMR